MVPRFHVAIGPAEARCVPSLRWMLGCSWGKGNGHHEHVIRSSDVTCHSPCTLLIFVDVYYIVEFCVFDWGVLLIEFCVFDWGVLLIEFCVFDWGVLLIEFCVFDWGVLLIEFCVFDWGVSLIEFCVFDWGV